MDKIREEFEKPDNFDNWPVFWKECYKDGRSSRDKEIKKLKDALEKAKQFIGNGVEYGYIKLPDPGDTALETLPAIKQALKESE